jgi:hypothetical protein
MVYGLLKIMTSLQDAVNQGKEKRVSAFHRAQMLMSYRGQVLLFFLLTDGL